MTTHKEALTLAREALVRADRISGYPNNKQTITAIDEALAQPEQPKVRTGDCLLVGVCASEGHKIQKAQPEQLEGLQLIHKADIDLAKKRVTEAQPEQEPHSWYSAQEDEWMTHKTRKEHERLNSYTHKVGKFDLALYTTPPQSKEPEQEPVIRWKCKGCGHEYMEAGVDCDCMTNKGYERIEYFTSPQRKPLTDEEIRKAKHHMVDGAYQYSFMQGVRYAEAAHGIKE